MIVIFWEILLETETSLWSKEVNTGTGEIAGKTGTHALHASDQGLIPRTYPQVPKSLRSDPKLCVESGHWISLQYATGMAQPSPIPHQNPKFHQKLHKAFFKKNFFLATMN